MSIQSLLDNNELEKIPISVKNARDTLTKANNFFGFVERSINDIPSNFREVLNNNIYDCLRISCSALLVLNGYRVKSRTGFHAITVRAASLLASEEFSKIFQRLQKMRKARNVIEYGTFISISDAQLKQGFADAKALIELMDALIKEKEPRLPLP